MNVSPDLGVDGSGCCWDCGGLKQSHDEASKIDGDPALITDVLWKSSWKVDVEIITWWCRCQPLGLSPIYAIYFIGLALSQSHRPTITKILVEANLRNGQQACSEIGSTRELGN